MIKNKSKLRQLIKARTIIAGFKQKMSTGDKTYEEISKMFKEYTKNYNKEA